MNQPAVTGESGIKLASAIVAGDSLTVPGSMIHEDLSGLRCQFTAHDVVYEPGWVGVVHRTDPGRPVTTWFKPDEPVQYYHPNP